VRLLDRLRRRPGECRAVMTAILASRQFRCTLGRHAGHDHAHRSDVATVEWTEWPDGNVMIRRATTPGARPPSSRDRM
jgi:hypothetical protein